MRHTIKVTFEDGDTITTGINGTKEEVIAYYVGQTFNFGDRDWGQSDRMVKATAVEFLGGN